MRDLDAVKREALKILLTHYIGSWGYDAVEYTVISGTDEAKYGWVAANHLQPGDPPYNVGYVEMGGASAQIAFPLPMEFHETAVNVVQSFKQVALPNNTAVLESVGPQELFLASYPLGTTKGYEAYKQALFVSTRPGIRDPDDPNVCAHSYLHLMRR